MTTLTVTQLRLLTLCERRVWLDKYGNRDEPLEVTAITTIAADTAVEIQVASWAEAVAITRSTIRHGHTIIGACLETEIELQGKPVRLMGKIDRLQSLADGTYYP